MPAAYDYHVLILAPGLGAAWFMQAAQEYWLRFQPLATADPQFLKYLPPTASVAVTLLVPPETADKVREEISACHSNVDLDVIIADDLPTVEATLNARAAAGRPFGEQRGGHHEPA